MESINILNERLIRDFGYFEGGVHPLWRIVWSEDQIEKREVWHTAEGFELLSPVVEERPKYRQWIHNKYVLEKAIPIPDGVKTDLIGKFSYEPIWVFEDAKGYPLPPRWDAIILIVENVYRAAARSIGAKYKDPEDDPLVGKEVKEQRIKELEAALFGNETETGDALAHKEAIVVPRSYES